MYLPSQTADPTSRAGRKRKVVQLTHGVAARYVLDSTVTFIKSEGESVSLFPFGQRIPQRIPPAEGMGASLLEPHNSLIASLQKFRVRVQKRMLETLIDYQEITMLL